MALPQITSPAWTPRTKRTVTLIVLLLIGLLLWQVADALPMIIITLILSYLLWPVVQFNERRLRFMPAGRRPMAVLFSFIFVIFLFALVVFLVVPVIVAQVQELGSNLPSMLSGLELELNRVLSEPLTFNGRPILIDGQVFIPLEQLRKATGAETVGEVFQFENLDLMAAAQGILGSVGGLTGSAFAFLGRAFDFGVNATLLLVMMFYLLKDGDVFAERIVHMAPPEYEGDVRRFMYELGQIWNAYLRGQLILSVVIGMAVLLAALALGLPNAPILALIAGLLEFIPNIGPFLAMIPAVFLAFVSQSTTLPFLEGPSLALAVVVVWTLIQNLESFLIVPRVMGDSLDLHPFVVIVAVLVGASLAGILGVLLAAPFVATGRLVLQYIYGKLTDQDPFSESAFPDKQWRNRRKLRAVKVINDLRGWYTRRTKNGKRNV